MKYRHYGCWLALLTCTAVINLPAMAANNPDETMVVTASRAPQRISDVAGTVWVVEGEQLQSQISAGADLKDALARLIPGLDMGSQSRTNYGQNMRGRSLLVMIDGISLNSSRDINRKFDSIDPFNIERVEVLSGASSLYGAGASGGIINIITKQGVAGDLQFASELGGRSGFNSDEDMRWRGAQSIEGGSDSRFGRLALAYERSGGAYGANGEMILPDVTQTSTQFNDTLDLMGSLTMMPAPGQQLRLSGQFYDSQQDSNYGVYLGDNLAGLSDSSQIMVADGLMLDAQPFTRRYQLDLSYLNERWLSQRLLGQIYLRSEEMGFYPFPVNYKVLGSSFPIFSASTQKTRISGGKLVLIKAWQPLTLSYGADLEWEQFSADQQTYRLDELQASGGLNYISDLNLARYPEISNRSQALFGQFQWAMTDDLDLNGGVRYQRVENQVGDFVPVLQQYLQQNGTYEQMGLGAPDAVAGGKASYGMWTANLGLLYRFSPGQQGWLTYSQGWDLPDPAKYYGQGSYNLGNAGPELQQGISVSTNPLQGIKTDALELGWRLTQGGLRTQLASYYSLSDKTIVTDRATLAIITRDKKKRIYGLEGQLDYDFDSGVYTGANVHWLRSQTEREGEWVALGAEQASPSSLGLNSGWRGERLNAELGWHYFADYQDEAGGRLSGVGLFNFGTGYRLPVGELVFGIQNLLDKQYETLWSQRAQILYQQLSTPELFRYPGSGRTFALTYYAKY